MTPDDKRSYISHCCACYVRVSTEIQCLDSQKLAIREYFEHTPHEYDSFTWYEDLAYSGAYNKRPAFLRMMRDMEKGHIGAIAVYKLDRLSRIPRTCIETILRIENAGCDFISVTQPMFRRDATFRYGMISIFAEIAGMEREQTIERIKAGMAAAAERGSQIGRVPVIDDEIGEQIIALRNTVPKRTSYKKIAEIVGVSVGAVHKYCKEVMGNGLYDESLVVGKKGEVPIVRSRRDLR